MGKPELLDCGNCMNALDDSDGEVRYFRARADCIENAREEWSRNSWIESGEQAAAEPSRVSFSWRPHIQISV